MPMVAGPRDYTQTTRMALAALSRGTCYFPGCRKPVIVFEAREPYLDVQIAHIRDASPGNRHDPTMSDDERRAFSNLILLCKPHHVLVDKRHPDRYSVDDLLSWKSKREADQGLDILNETVDEGNLEDGLLAAVAEDQRHLQVGGAGGSAPGAGGGGGGVLGSGTGGPGGPGMPIYVGDHVPIRAEGTPATSPGAGGGGAGVVLPGTLARRPGPDEGSEGEGYSVGIDGQDGQASSFGDHVKAPGGKGGLAGHGPRLRSEALRLSMLTLANSGEIRNNLLFLLGAGWQSRPVLNLGTTVTFPIVLLFEAAGVDPGSYTVRISIEDPSGQSVATTSFPVTVKTAGDVLRIPRLVAIDVSVTSFGIWRVTAHSDVALLGSLDVMVKRAGVS